MIDVDKKLQRNEQKDNCKLGFCLLLISKSSLAEIWFSFPVTENWNILCSTYSCLINF